MTNWLNHNFPNTTSDQQLKGVMEELGELCHADLKQEQGIRGYNKEKSEAEIKDAVGDIIIYLTGYCIKKEVLISDCIETALNEVLKRDWIKNPETGKPKEEPIIDMICCLCGNTVRGRQFKTRQEGQTICSDCVSSLKRHAFTDEQFSKIYGINRYHYNIKE